MNIYISTSWKQRKLVKEYTAKLRALKHTVYNFTETPNETQSIPPEYFLEQFDPATMNYKEYITKTEFILKMKENWKAIHNCDLIILLLPAGNDAHADWSLGVGLGKHTIVVGHPVKGDRSPTHLWANVILTDIDETLSYVQSLF